MKIHTPAIRVFLLLCIIKSSLIAQNQEQHQVTAAEYCDFLNKHAAVDSSQLFDQKQATDSGVACIVRQGKPGSFHYEVIVGREDVPVRYVDGVDEEKYSLQFQLMDQNQIEPDKKNQPYLKSNNNFLSISLPEMESLSLVRAGSATNFSNGWSNSKIFACLSTAALMTATMLATDNLRASDNQGEPEKSPLLTEQTSSSGEEIQPPENRNNRASSAKKGKANFRHKTRNKKFTISTSSNFKSSNYNELSAEDDFENSLEYLAVIKDATTDYAKAKIIKAYEISKDAIAAYEEAKRLTRKNSELFQLLEYVSAAKKEALSLAFSNLAKLKEEAEQLKKEAENAYEAYNEFCKQPKAPNVSRAKKTSLLTISKKAKKNFEEADRQLQESYLQAREQTFLNNKEWEKSVDDDGVSKEVADELAAFPDKNNKEAIEKKLNEKRKDFLLNNEKANKTLKEASCNEKSLEDNRTNADKTHKYLHSLYQHAHKKTDAKTEVDDELATDLNNQITDAANETIAAWEYVIKLAKETKAAWEDAGKAVKSAHITKVKWAKTLLQLAEKGRDNFGLGYATKEEVNFLGKIWAGLKPDVQSKTSYGESFISLTNILTKRRYRSPSWKPRDSKWQANFEREIIPGSIPRKFKHNGHVDITDLSPPKSEF